ncbi:MAG: squalene--hopene cyclase [Pirellulales bacterium]|nr:squalene--hopene cyclase [Pirellulales bacterium]
MIDLKQLAQAHKTVSHDLLAQRTETGRWVGQLSASALATATAVSALALVDRRDSAGPSHGELINRAVDWLAHGANDDGGWGDTDQSRSNIATTMLVRAAFHLAGAAGVHEDLLRRAEDYVGRQGGVDGLRRRYGRDRTFAVPILTNCALAGLVPWSDVAPLPFELACLPHWMLRFLRLPVVSYALPALVAIGQIHYHHVRPPSPLRRVLRRVAVEPSLKRLRAMQPASGGYLEATPLTSFVVMSLAGMGRAEHPVARDGVRFLRASVREDGSWPIDTNLSTWNTTLAVNALSDAALDDQRERLGRWILSCQHRTVHPFTQAAAGGWGWTDLSGAVPDADDTAGALLALARLAGAKGDSPLFAAATSIGRQNDSCADKKETVPDGVHWLLGLQNRDGGWPTFCRGWGALPFDRSGADLTAHAIRALHAWRNVAPAKTQRAIARGFSYLERTQRPDGAWIPLWFGNEHSPNDENPVYGTARVLLAYRDLGRVDTEPARRAMHWLCSHRNDDGGWGGDPRGVSSVEETAVAVEALFAGMDVLGVQVVAEKGLAWLLRAVADNWHRSSAPIGFYFARLWYYELMYPLIFAASALRRAISYYDDRNETPASRSTDDSASKRSHVDCSPR